jgi:hypothetical protein
MWPNVSVEQPSNCPKKHWASSSWQASMEGGGYQQCDQSQIMLSCNGFQSFEGVDPLILKKIGDNCLLYNGHLLSPRNIDVFAYASDSSFPFVPVSSVTGTCHQKDI